MNEVQILGSDFEEIDGLVKRAVASGQMKGKPVVMKAPGEGHGATPRDMAMMRIDQIDDERIIQGLKSRRLAIVDSQYYWVKDIAAVGGAAGGTISMITTGDVKAPGATNVVQGSLDTDNWFLCTGIILKTGLYATDVTHLLEAEFNLKAIAGLALTPNVANGDFEFRVNGGKHVVPKDTSCQVFCTGKTTEAVGYFKLSSPKWIRPKSDMFFDIKLPKTITAVPALTACRLELVGASVVVY